MITDIIDLIVDASNTFGSLISSLQARFKNYNRIIEQQSSLQDDVVGTIYTSFPEIQNEIAVCSNKISYVVIDKYSIKNGKTEMHIVFLDANQKYIHSFSILSRMQAIMNFIIPCFWKVKL